MIMSWVSPSCSPGQQTYTVGQQAVFETIYYISIVYWFGQTLACNIQQANKGKTCSKFLISLIQNRSPAYKGTIYNFFNIFIFFLNYFYNIYVLFYS